MISTINGKKLKLFTLLLLTLFSTNSFSQDFSSILDKIEQNSTALLASRKQADAEIRDTKVMTALDAPELGFNYLFGNGDIGNRYDLNVSQTFDFPTTIIQRNKFAKEQRRIAELRYLSARQQLLLTARKLCIEVVYCNVMMEHLNEDLDETRAMADAYEILFNKGEATVIDHNKAHQAFLFFEAEYREFMATRNSLLDQLKYLAGGQEITIDDTVYTHTPLTTDFDQWLSENISRHPSLQLSEGMVSAQKRELKLAKSEWAPKFRIGYMGEFEKVDRYQGPTIGLSIPIWSGTRRVKAAKAHLEAAEMENADARQRLTTQLRSIYNDALQLQETYSQYSQHLSGCDNTELLEQSLKKGQITLLTYLQERQYVHEMHERLITAERDLELRKAELAF